MSNEIINLDFAFLDLETTGLKASRGHRICEIAVVTTKGKTILSKYEKLLDPKRPISPGAAAVNGLCDSDLIGCPEFKEIVSEVESVLRNRIVVCHNASFDLEFLDREFRRAGKRLSLPQYIDTLFLARDYFRFESNSLGKVAACLQVPVPAQHRALADAITTMRVFFRMVELLNERGIGVRKLLRSPTFPDIYPEWKYLPAEIRHALQHRSKLFIRYMDRNRKESEREIIPLDAYEADGKVYIYAYCMSRQEERNFLLHRIVEAKPTEEMCVHERNGDVNDYELGKVDKMLLGFYNWIMKRNWGRWQK